jgi:hypothetical protein
VTERLELLRAAGARKRGFCLRVWSETREAYLYAPLSEMAWQVLPAHVPSAGAGSFRIKLTWLRASVFYGAEVALPLSNGSGSGVTGGLTLYNHDDPSLWHDNWFDVNLQAVGNLWEFPLRLELKNTTSGEALADFWLGSMALATGNTAVTTGTAAVGGNWQAGHFPPWTQAVCRALVCCLCCVF